MRSMTTFSLLMLVCFSLITCEVSAIDPDTVIEQRRLMHQKRNRLTQQRQVLEEKVKIVDLLNKCRKKNVDCTGNMFGGEGLRIDSVKLTQEKVEAPQLSEYKDQDVLPLDEWPAAAISVIGGRALLEHHGVRVFVKRGDQLKGGFTVRSINVEGISISKGTEVRYLPVLWSVAQEENTSL